jgi:hypothetical protein
MGGFILPAPEPEVVTERDEGTAETLRHVEILGRLILRQIGKLERQQMTDHATLEQVLAATAAQKTAIDSMAVLITGIRARLNQALAGELSPAAQAKLDAALAEIQGNTRSITNAVVNSDDDPTNDVDGLGNPLGVRPTPDTSGSSTNQDPNAPINEPTESEKAVTSTTLSTSKALANLGEEITLTAAVSAASGTDKPVTGVVTFATDGGAIGRAGLDSTGVAAMSTTVTAGDHSITATYGGDDNFASSTSEAITQSALAPNQPQGDPATGTDQGSQSGTLQQGQQNPA